MLAALAIIVSAVFYRVPRGGPSEEGWREWIKGFKGFGSFGGALIWAVFTACSIGYLVGLPYWAWGVATVALMAAEAPGWADYWPNNTDGGSFWKLTLRGCVLLNPLMGAIYFGLYRVRRRLPRWGLFIDGWTAWAELFSGMVTATGVFLILTGLNSVF